MPLPGDPRPQLPTEHLREAERLRAEAAQIRERAVREAEQIIARAATIARQVEDESRSSAEATTAAARAEAHRLVSEAWQHVDAIVRKVDHMVAALGPLQPAVERVRQLRATAPLGVASDDTVRPEAKQYGA